MDAAQEILRVAWGALRASWPSLFACGFVGAGLLAVERRLPRVEGAVSRWRATAFGACLAAAVGVGLWQAWRILWIADDAFISFRYAKNFARGWGLVYNEGEWVEGYTNFLWTFTLGVLAKLGFDIPLTALALNLLAFVGTLVGVALVVRRLVPRPPWIPFAALALAGAKPMYTFASSGLETIVLALCSVWAFRWTLGQRRTLGAVAASLTLTASILCRPDQLLVWGSLGLALVGEDLRVGRGRWWQRLDWGRYAAYGLPWVGVMVPYFLLRWRAYGALFPNTFYTKSGSGAYWSQGFVYLSHFLVTTGAWLWLPLFFWWALRRPAPAPTADPADAPGREAADGLRLRLFALGAVLTLGLYVVRVGGDFMEHRFFVPLLPLIAMVVEVGVRRWLATEAATDAEAAGGWRGWAWAGAVWVAASLAFAWTPVRVIRPFEIRWHLAAEETFYQVGSLFPLRIENGHFDAGKWLHEIFVDRGLRPRMAGGAIGMVGYYGDLPLFDVMGLTSKSIASQPIRTRGRPGHEKRASVQEILDDGVVIDLNPVLGMRWAHLTLGQVQGRKFHFLRYDPALVEALAQVEGAKLPEPGREIQQLLDGGTREALLEARTFFVDFLRGWEEGPGWLERIDARLAAVADFEEPSDDGRWAKGPFRVVRHDPPRGVSGLGWLTSMGLEGVGEVRLPLPVVGEELRFLLGGPASQRLGVRLLHAGEVVLVAHPRGTPGLEPVVWDVGRWLGETLELEVFDQDVRAGTGLELDALHFAAGPGDLRVRIARVDEGTWGPLLREAEALLPADDPDRLRLEACVAERYTFDEGLPEGSQVVGEAFAAAPSAGALRRQQPVRGARGAGLLNSFRRGDISQGRLLLPEQRLLGAPIHLLVGGGASCQSAYVGLEVGGKVVAKVCGFDDEILRPAILETAPWAGVLGRVVVVDRSAEPWGHILVDDVVFQRPGCAGKVPESVGVKASSAERKGAGHRL